MTTFSTVLVIISTVVFVVTVIIAATLSITNQDLGHTGWIAALSIYTMIIAGFSGLVKGSE